MIIMNKIHKKRIKCTKIHVFYVFFVWNLLNVYRGNFICIKKYNPKYSIRISLKNFGFENNIKSISLYAVFCINK